MTNPHAWHLYIRLFTGILWRAPHDEHSCELGYQRSTLTALAALYSSCRNTSRIQLSCPALRTALGVRQSCICVVLTSSTTTVAWFLQTVDVNLWIQSRLMLLIRSFTVLQHIAALAMPLDPGTRRLSARRILLYLACSRCSFAPGSTSLVPSEHVAGFFIPTSTPHVDCGADGVFVTETTTLTNHLPARQDTV